MHFLYWASGKCIWGKSWLSFANKIQILKAKNTLLVDNRRKTIPWSVKLCLIRNPKKYPFLTHLIKLLVLPGKTTAIAEKLWNIKKWLENSNSQKYCKWQIENWNAFELTNFPWKCQTVVFKKRKKTSIKSISSTNLINLQACKW